VYYSSIIKVSQIGVALSWSICGKVVVKRGDLREKTDKKGFPESDRGMAVGRTLGLWRRMVIDSEQAVKEV
jgi:hypothetical protein